MSAGKNREPCEYCKLPGKYLDAPLEIGGSLVYMSISGEYLQVFDSEYPGMCENIEINYCPICGRYLKRK